MKKTLTVVLSILTAISFALCVNADSLNRTVISNNDFEVIISNDKSAKITSFQQNVTVINIPESIEGYDITEFPGMELSSSCVTKIVFGDNIATVSSLAFSSEVKPEIPICSLRLNEGLKTISSYSDITNREDGLYYQNRIPKLIKYLVLPESLKTIEKSGLYTTNYENIVIQSNIETEDYSITRNCSDEENYKLFNPVVSTNVFLSSGVSIPVNSFNMVSYSDVVNPEDHPDININRYLTINTKPYFPNQFEEAGYTVKEYTDEWWKDIKEIQSVEVSGEGVTLKKDSKGKGTVTELGWSPSNDPAQYLSREYELSAKPGDSFTLKSSFAPADAFDDRTFFVSLNEDVATVDTESGKVTVLKEGTATIRCVAASGVFSDCFIYSGSAAQTQAKTQAKSDSLKAKTPLIVISCSCAAVLAAGVVVFTVKKKRRKV